MVTANLKGVNDFTPQTMSQRNQITDILRRNFERYGFQPLETAMLNYRDLLTYKYGDQAEIVKEIYQLHDQGDRDLGLRFDLTVPFCKFIALNRNLKMPFKRYEIGKVFRNGPVKAGRLREFVQCDVDVVGDGSRYIEVEMLDLAIRCYRELGLTPEIRLGHRQLLNGLIDLVGGTAHAEAIIGVLDKILKVTPAETLTELQKYLPAPQAEKLLHDVNSDYQTLAKLLPDNVGIRELGELFTQLHALGFDQYCRFTPSLARGLNIYTGVVWEVFDGTHRYQSSLGGGGRYDQIITNFIGNGNAYPAVGMSFGLEPIATLLQTNQAQTRPQLLLMPFGNFAPVVALANKLRDHGIRVFLWTAKPKPAKALEYANATGIPYTAVIGENELTTGQFALKNMTTGAEQTIQLNDLKTLLKTIK